ncbi:MAG: AAA family ATPase [Planctomycetes bacterium]|nr:AAA family ATPase [Planctomycetota bacterium]
MKILAIRGQNLASLARSFAVELGTGPLAAVGLFAITGPVGAGKSTLLDALCLALFDRTPRLSNRGGTPIGDDVAAREDWLRSNDPRTLLRRDAPEAHAEVDFTGRDGARYRARWSVRRARRKRDGRVQDTEMSLTDIDRNVAVASGRKTEVLAAIEARLGLDFGQFCRSVLLAQGDFAAFLRAPADERARLLETLTGADVYRRLSRAAHERRRAVAAQVDLLRGQLDAQPLLDDATRAALEADRAALEVSRSTCSLGVELAQKYVAWHTTALVRQEEESRAAVDLQSAIAADERAAERRRLHTRMVKASALVAHRSLVVAAERERAVADTAARIAGEAAANATREADAARRSFVAVWQAVGGGDVVPRIVHELPQWERMAEEYAATRRLAAAFAGRIAQCETAERGTAAALEAAAVRVAAAEAARDAAHAAMEAARAACAAPEVVGVAAQRRRLDARRDATTRAHDAAAAAVAAENAFVAAETRCTESAATLEAGRAARSALVETASGAAEALRSTRAAAERLRAEAGLASLRVDLVAGEPCPLCGSREHAVADVHGSDAAKAAEDAVACAQRGADEAARRLFEHDALLLAAERQLAAERRALDAAAAARGSAFVAWRAAAEPDDDLRGAADRPAAGLTIVRQRVIEIGREQAAITEAERCAAGLAAAFDAAARVFAKAAQDVEVARRAEREATAGQRRAAEALAEARAGARENDATIVQQRQALAVAFAGVDAWPDVWERLGDEVTTKLRELHRLDANVRDAAAVRDLARRKSEDLLVAAARAASGASLAAVRLEGACGEAGVTGDEVAAAMRLGSAAIEEEGALLAAFATAVEKARVVLRERVEQRRKHEAAGRPELDAAEAKSAYEDARRAREAVEDRLLDVQVRLAADDGVRRHRGEIAPRLAEAEAGLATWQALDDLIGSSTGDAFVVFAQGLTLDLLLVEANRRLADLARRYRLERNTTGEMDFVVVDLDLGGTRRGVQTLSGGESFLVSLALALALATLAAPKTRVETLLLDEGFGTLDAQHLEAALGALDTLQATGCQVGVISHVDGIAERIGAVVEVRPEGGGQSRVLARVR